MDRNEARDKIKAEIPCDRYLTKSFQTTDGKYMYNCPCPNCRSGTKTHKTGAVKWYEKDNTWSCHACHGWGDVIKLYRIVYGVDYNTALAELARELGITIDRWTPGATAAQAAGGSLPFNGGRADKEKSQGDPPSATREEPTQMEKSKKDFTESYAKWREKRENDPRFWAYIEGRGLSRETARQDDYMWNGYVLIVPSSRYGCQKRDPNATEGQERYKWLSGSEHGLFHEEYLYAQHTQGVQAVFVTEGAIDASSVHEVGYGAGYRAIGLMSAGNAGLFVKKAGAAQKAGTLTKAKLIVCVDNDEHGEDARRTLRDGLTRLGIPFLVADISPGCKDANEYFVKDRAGFKAAVEAAAAADPEKPQQAPMEAAGTRPPAGSERQPEGQPPTGSGQQPGEQTPAGSGQQAGGQPPQAPKPMTGPETVDAFMELVQDPNKPFEPIPTGIADIDRALGGGFTRKTLVTLGAPPAMGKTAIAQWMLEGVARGERDVLYLNLEMAREQLLARSLSRIVWKRHKGEEGLDLSAMDILRGYAWTDAQKAAIKAAAEEYKREIAAHFVYNPDGMTNKLDKILEAMRNEVLRLKELGRPAPLVCVDYLQIVDPGDRRDPVDGLKNTINQLKDFAINHDTVVLAIVAHNRESNKRGVSDMESGRDTSAIEYSGDVMLGLSYTAIEDGQTVTFDYVDAEGATQTAKETATIDAIRRAKRGAHDLGIDVPVFCNKLSLKVMKGRFSDSERVARLVFDGKHSDFAQLERGAKGGWVQLQEGEPTPFDEPAGQAAKGAKGASSKGKRR